MKINELLTNIKNNEFKLDRGLEVTKYLPMEVKKAIAQSILYDCIDEESGVARIDSVEKYMAYVRHMIVTHTNLEYSDDDYDALCSTEYGDTTLLNAIIGCFEEDAKECSRILNLMMDDKMQEMSIEFTIAKFLNGISDSLSDIVKPLSEKLGDFDFKSMLPGDEDANKFGEFLKNYK